MGDGPSAIGGKNPDFVEIPSMSKKLSNFCPISNFLHSKSQNVNPEHFIF